LFFALFSLCRVNFSRPAREKKCRLSKVVG
jgi:hypothetical protein